MTQVIIYPLDSGALAIVYPCDPSIPVEEIARKDVPAGVPFRIVSPSDLPDPHYRDAWTADFSEPDGVGIGADAWFAEQAAQGNS